MAGHPARNRSVRCAVNQSGRATYEISRRSSPTAITSATSITAKVPFLHSNIMRWHHDNPRRFKISPANGSQPQARLQRRNCESSGCSLLLFRVGLLSKPQRLNPSRASKVPTIDLFKPDHTMVANSRGQHTLQKEILSVWRRRSARQRGSDYTHRSATIGGTEKRYRPDHRDDRLEMTKAP